MATGTSRLKELIEVAEEGSGEARRDLLRDITDVFMAAPDRYTSSELQHFDVIMSRVAEQVEAALRREIAEKIADTPNAPKGLIRQLANDEITIAEPVLRRSDALSEDDLLRIVRRRGQAHMKAISQRREVPEKLTEEIVERGGGEVLVSLAQNQGARFTSNAMKRMVTQSRSIKDLQTPLAERPDMPPALLTEMYFFVSSALKREILKRSDMLDPVLIDEAVNENRQKILTETVREVQTEVAGARRFISDKLRASAVNESLLKELVDARRPTEFLLAFSHIVGVDPPTAQAILKDKTWEALAVASRAVGLERATFAKIVFGIQRTDEEQTKALRILDLYLKIPQEAAERVMRFWRVRARGEAAAMKTAAKPEAPARRAVG